MHVWGVLLRTVGVLCAVIAMAVIWSVAPAFAHEHYTFTGSFGTEGSAAGELSNPGSMAMNEETGDIYVADTGNRRIDEFSSSGLFIRAWGWGVANGAAEPQRCEVSCLQGISGSSPGEFEDPIFVAVDNSSGKSKGDVYVADNADSLVTKFDSNGNLITNWGNNGTGHVANGQLNGSNATPKTGKYTTVEGPFRAPFDGIAVGFSGALWVESDPEYVFEFDESGAFAQSWYAESGHTPFGIDVDISGNVYVIMGFDQVEERGSDGSQLGRLPTQHVTGMAIDPSTNEIYADSDGLIEHYASTCRPEVESSCQPTESFESPQSAGGTSLTVSSSTGLIYVVVPDMDDIAIFTPEVPAPPAIESQAVSFVTSGSATFSARVNPNGSETLYHVEYGPTTSYGETVPVPDGIVGSGFDGQEVNVHVQDLIAHTIYHFRVVYRNSLGTVYGKDEEFTTQASGSALGLPDDRSWELVTPADKFGALFYGQNYGQPGGSLSVPFVAEASSDGNAMINLASQPTEAEPQGYSNEVSVFSARGSGGWSSQVIAPPNNEGTGPSVGRGSEYNFFSEDLSLGVLLPFGNFYALSSEATEATPYVRSDFLNGDVNSPCLSNCYRPLVTAADTRKGAVFGEEAEGECNLFNCGPKFVDATPNASHIVISSSVQLTVTPNSGLYEWSSGHLQPLDLLPVSEGGTGVSASVLSPVTHELSDDGNVFFSYGGHLYLHDFAKDNSVRLDVAQGVAEPSEDSASFLYASSDGSKVLFSDTQQLTKASGGGIYECRVTEAAGEATCELELTGLSGGSLIGGSEDASYLYFRTADEKLSVDHFDGTQWATAAGAQPISGTTLGHSGNLPIYRISPNGRFLTFMSSEDLTGYDSRDAVSGRPDVEVYMYGAESNRLICASCNPSGARPVGVEYSVAKLVGGSLGNSWEASNLPPWTESTPQNVYQPRFLSDSGRLFFDSNDALVPQDVNGTQDVYEYEPAGIGSCTSSSVTYGERSGGCVSLISSGSSPEESAFMDASETGGDVFFITLSKLVSQDFDNALDVYDAHECSAIAPCFPSVPESPPVCSTGDACKPAPSPQPAIFGAAPSATFSGAGNVGPSSPTPFVGQKSLTKAQKLARALKACRKKAHKRRAVCERQARKRYGSAAGRPGKPSSKRKDGR